MKEANYVQIKFEEYSSVSRELDPSDAEVLSNSLTLQYKTAPRARSSFTIWLWT